ncbi:hypothetical protein VP01_9g10, partial [Puccinia sorghi]
MTNFYAMQLRDANKTIETLCNKVTRDQQSEQGHYPSRKGTELKIKDQALKSKVE